MTLELGNKFNGVWNNRTIGASGTSGTTAGNVTNEETTKVFNPDELIDTASDLGYDAFVAKLIELKNNKVISSYTFTTNDDGSKTVKFKCKGADGKSKQYEVSFPKEEAATFNDEQTAKLAESLKQLATKGWDVFYQRFQELKDVIAPDGKPLIRGIRGPIKSEDGKSMSIKFNIGTVASSVQISAPLPNNAPPVSQANGYSGEQSGFKKYSDLKTFMMDSNQFIELIEKTGAIKLPPNTPAMGRLRDMKIGELKSSPNFKQRIQMIYAKHESDWYMVDKMTLASDYAALIYKSVPVNSTTTDAKGNAIRTVEYTYDKDFNVTSRTETVYERDAKGNVISETKAVYEGNSVDIKTKSKTIYDENGNPYTLKAEYSYDAETKTASIAVSVTGGGKVSNYDFTFRVSDKPKTLAQWDALLNNACSLSTHKIQENADGSKVVTDVISEYNEATGKVKNEKETKSTYDKDGKLRTTTETETIYNEKGDIVSIAIKKRDSDGNLIDKNEIDFDYDYDTGLVTITEKNYVPKENYDQAQAQSCGMEASQTRLLTKTTCTTSIDNLNKMIALNNGVSPHGISDKWQEALDSSMEDSLKDVASSSNLPSNIWDINNVMVWKALLALGARNNARDNIIDGMDIDRLKDSINSAITTFYDEDGNVTGETETGIKAVGGDYIKYELELKYEENGKLTEKLLSLLDAEGDKLGEFTMKQNEDGKINIDFTVLGEKHEAVSDSDDIEDVIKDIIDIILESLSKAQEKKQDKYGQYAAKAPNADTGYVSALEELLHKAFADFI